MSSHSDAFSTDLVTGDAVAVELRYAKLASRSLAFAVDVTLQVVALVMLVFLVGALSGTVDAVLVYVVGFLATLAVLVGYPVVCETLSRGRTVGKLALGLRVVRDDGGAIRLRHAMVRGLLAVVEVYLFLAISVISSLLSPTGKRLGDYLAGTVVVRERAPRGHEYTPWVHPHLEPWVATLELARLQPTTALNARRYLSRMGGLSGEARARLGSELAAEVASQTSPAPPDGLPPEVYLSAVLAERSRRGERGARHSTPPGDPAPELAEQAPAPAPVEGPFQPPS